jgi:hypothetical protein
LAAVIKRYRFPLATIVEDAIVEIMPELPGFEPLADQRILKMKNGRKGISAIAPQLARNISSESWTTWIFSMRPKFL